MFARDTTRMLRQPVGAEHLATDGPDEPSLSAICATEKIQKSVRGITGRGYGCHGVVKMPETWPLPLTTWQLFKLRDNECSSRVCVQLSIHVNQATICDR